MDIIRYSPVKSILFGRALIENKISVYRSIILLSKYNCYPFQKVLFIRDNLFDLILIKLYQFKAIIPIRKSFVVLWSAFQE